MIVKKSNYLIKKNNINKKNQNSLKKKYKSLNEWNKFKIRSNRRFFNRRVPVRRKRSHYYKPKYQKIKLLRQFRRKKDIKQRRRLFVKKWRAYFPFLRRQKCFNINFLTTKTNIFLTVTTFWKGKLLYSITPRRLDPKVYFNTKKRTSWAAQAVTWNMIRWLRSRHRKEKRRKYQHSIYIINFYGINPWIQKKMCNLLIRLNRFLFFMLIRHKQMIPHNGSSLKIRKRKKNKGWNRFVKRKKKI